MVVNFVLCKMCFGILNGMVFVVGNGEGVWVILFEFGVKVGDKVF